MHESPRKVQQILDAIPLGPTFTLHDAVLLSALAHHGQTDKGRPSQPYLTHPLRVQAEFDDSVLQMIAVLHDAVEDSDGSVTTATLEALGVPPRVVAGVAALTHQSGESREEYLRRVRGNPDALAVKAADNRDNSDPGRLALLSDERSAHFQAKYERDRRLLGIEAHTTTPKCRDENNPPLTGPLVRCAATRLPPVPLLPCCKSQPPEDMDTGTVLVLEAASPRS